MYPDAQFVLLVREPVATIASTLAMWKSLCRTQSFEALGEAQLEDCVLDTYLAMQRSLIAVRDELGPGQFHELQYERLLEDPLREMVALYTALGLGPFDYTRPDVVRHLQSIKIHRPAVHRLSERLQARIRTDLA